MIRALSALAVIALAFLPIGAVAASGPNPDTLRATLADPPDTNWTEADVGAAAAFEGPIDIKFYKSYYETYGQDANWIQLRLRTLEQNGFVGGYGRQWYRLGTLERLNEVILVFTTASGAMSVLNGNKIMDAELPGAQSLFDPQLSQGAYGVTIYANAYSLTVLGLRKGNALLGIGWGSENEITTGEALAQARKVYQTAPASIPVSARTNSGSVFARYIQLIEIAGLGLLLVAAAALAVVSFVVLVMRRRIAPPVKSNGGP